MNTDLKEKAARARSDYKDALESLSIARETYLKGSGNSYSRALERQNTIRSKIANAETEIKNADDLVKTSLEKNHFVTTDAVKEALYEKAEAQNIKDALKRSLEESELPMLPLMVEASRDAKAYLEAFRRANEAYARRELYDALEHCAGPLSRALALMGHVPGTLAEEHLLRDEFEVRERRIGFVWKTLKAMAASNSYAASFPHVAAIGMLELGIFANGKFISPLQAQKMKRELEALQQKQEEDTDTE